MFGLLNKIIFWWKNKHYNMYSIWGQFRLNSFVGIKGSPLEKCCMKLQHKDWIVFINSTHVKSMEKIKRRCLAWETFTSWKECVMFISIAAHTVKTTIHVLIDWLSQNPYERTISCSQCRHMSATWRSENIIYFKVSLSCKGPPAGPGCCSLFLQEVTVTFQPQL